MSALAEAVAAGRVADRVAATDWDRVARDLDDRGNAVLERLLSADACRGLAALYQADGVFRSRIVMGRHGFGRGEYQYFDYPLPDIIAELRTTLYPHLGPPPTAGTRP